MLLLAVVLASALSACGGSGASGSGPTATQASQAPTTAPTPRPSPTARPGQAAIAAFVARVTAGDFSYRMSLKGSVAASVDRGDVSGRLDTNGRDYALSLTYDFTEEYPGSPTLKVLVREVDGTGYLKEDTAKWKKIRDYVPADSAIPFATVTTVDDLIYRETAEVGGKVRYRVEIANAMVIHPRAIPGLVTDERIRRTTMELWLDDEGRPVSGTWILDATGRVGDSGQLQHIVAELTLTFTKIGDTFTIERP